MGIAYNRDISKDRIALFAAAAALAAGGALISPERLASLGLMAGSLEHELELVRRTTLFEIKAIRIAALLAGAVCAVLAVLWPRIATSDSYRRFVSADMRLAPRHAGYKAAWLNLSFFLMLAATAVLAGYAVKADLFLDAATRGQINREDGTIEELSAVLLLVAAAMSFAIARRVGRGDRRFPMHLFLGVLFIVMCGEEISWGQRYLALETPENLAAVNIQGEINFHNMYGYFFDHLFIAAFFIWMAVVPLAAAHSRFFRRLFWTVGLPVASFGLAAGALVVYVVFFFLLGRIIETIPGLRLAEPRELMSALAFVVLMAEVLVFVIASQPREEAARGRPLSDATVRRGPR